MGRKSLEISELDKTLAAQFLQERKKREWTEARLGEKANLSQSIIHRVLSGAYAIKISQAAAIARAFGKSLTFFIARAEDAQRSRPAPASVPSLADLSAMTPDQLLALGLADHHHQPSPLDGVGEESQINPEESRQ